MRKKVEYFVLGVNLLGQIPDECKNMKGMKFH